MRRHKAISAYAQTHVHQCACAYTRPSVPMRRHTRSSARMCRHMTNDHQCTCPDTCPSVRMRRHMTISAHAQTQGHQCLCADTHIHQCTLHMHMRRHKAISDHAQAHVHQCACADSVRVEDSTIWSSLECQSGGLGSAKDRSGSGDRIGLQIPPKTRGYSL